MPYKDPEKQKQFKVKWRKNRFEGYNQWKLGLSCELCGESEPCTLDFHHRDPKEKESGISSLRDKSLERIKEEAAKCVVLCSNCHRKVHAGIAQLKEHLTCNENVEGLNPSTGSNTLQ